MDAGTVNPMNARWNTFPGQCPIHSPRRSTTGPLRHRMWIGGQLCSAAVGAILTLILLGPGSALLCATEISRYVSPTGSDQASGSAQSPWATPQHALNQAVEIAGQFPKAKVQVVLHAGTYRITEPLSIHPKHVPLQGSLTVRAANGEQAVISGGRVVSGWTVQEDGTWSVELPEVRQGKWSFRELFVAAKRRTRARFPNSGYLRIADAFPDKRSGFVFSEGDLPSEWSAGGELVFLHDWSISRIPVKSVDHATRQLAVAFPIGNNAEHYKIDHFEAHPRFFLENHSAFFDAAGEWLLDEKQCLLHYKPLPSESPETIEVVAPLAAALIIVAGNEMELVRNVHLHGLHLEHCAWQLPVGGYASSQATAYERRDNSPQHLSRAFIPAAVQFELAEDCSFTAGSIAHVGTSGIQFGSRTQRCKLEDSRIEDISGNGVNLGEDTTRTVGGRAWWQVAEEQAASQHVVARNRIERCGAQFFGAVAIWGGIVRNQQITHNEIAHHPYTGVSLGWMWNPTPTPAANNRVTHNHIHHVMQVLSDGGGIYTLGRQPGSQLIGNVIHDIPLNAGRAESNGMFLDEGSDQVIIADNVIFNTVRSPLRFHKAEQIVVRNNNLVVPNTDTPPLRFNSTSERTIEQVENRILVRSEFDPQAVTLPMTGPQLAAP